MSQIESDQPNAFVYATESQMYEQFHKSNEIESDYEENSNDDYYDPQFNQFDEYVSEKEAISEEDVRRQAIIDSLRLMLVKLILVKREKRLNPELLIVLKNN